MNIVKEKNAINNPAGVFFGDVRQKIDRNRISGMKAVRQIIFDSPDERSSRKS